MIIRRVLILLPALLCLLALIALAQEEDDARVSEEDYRVTSLEDRERAVANLRSKADELRKSNQLIEAALTLNRVGRFQIRMFRPLDAVSTFQKALKLLDQQDDVKAQIDSLNGLATSYDFLSKCDLAEPLANRAINQSKQHNYVAGQAEALITVSDCQNHRDHVLALKTANQSLELWRSIGRKRGMADAHKTIGHYQLAQNDLLECSKSMEAALSLFRELNDTDQQAAVLNYLAMIEHRKGAWQNALALYTQVQSMIDEKAEPYKMGQIAFGLADAFLESGLPEVALRKFRESLEYFQSTKNERAVSIVYWSIGRAHYFLGNYQEALVNLQRALSEAESRKDVTLSAFCNDFLGRTHAARNDSLSALKHFQYAIEGYTSAKNPMEVARTQALIGQVYEQRGELDKARVSYQTALKTFDHLEDHINGSATLFAIGKLELKDNHLDRAEEYLRNLIETTESIRRVSTSYDLTTAFSAAVHDRYQSYIECLMRKHELHPDQGFDVRAFEISELARARSLVELLRATETNLAPGVDPKLIEQEKSLRQSLRVKDDYKVSLLGKQYSKAELDALNLEIEKLRNEHKQITEIIRTQHPSYQQITQPVAWDLRRIEREIVADEQTMLLEYSIGAHKSYVWAVTRDGLKSFELPPEDVITKAAKNVYDLLSRQPVAETEKALSEASQELSRLILSPVAEELNKRTIIVVADGVLNYIPFQVLPLSSPNNRPLIAQHEIINAPSASILGELNIEARRRQLPTKALAAFGNPKFASGQTRAKDENIDELIALNTARSARWRSALRDIELNGDSFDPSVVRELFYAKRELANLRDVAGQDALVVSEYDATRERFLSADLTQYAMLHLATHGYLNPKRPETSGFVLSTVDRGGKEMDGFVGLQEIYELRTPVALVVLSACQTALGKDVRGEGLVGLTRGFMYAGASSVVASLWKVDDEATAELMQHFYSNLLQKKMTPAAALRDAQNTIRQRPGWNSPYYWAAFTLQGNYRESIQVGANSGNTTRYRIIIFGTLFLVLLVAAASWFHRRRVRSRG